MPKYFYKCDSCDVVSSFYHEMSHVVTDCSDCGAKDSLVKKPSFFNSEKQEKDDKKVGDLVKASIHEFSRDLKEQKEELRSEFISENK